MDRTNRAVEVFSTHEKPDDYCVVAVIESSAEVEEAVRKLQESGIDLKRCSLVGKENLTGEYVIGYYFIEGQIAYWGKKGAFWGGIWGQLAGSAFFMIPGIGSVLVGGPFVSAIVGALEGSMVVGGLSALGAGFYNLGIPQRSILDYEVAVKADHFVVIVHGNSAESAEVKTLLETSPIRMNTV